jgi:hypothetical protein
MHPGKKFTSFARLICALLLSVSAIAFTQTTTARVTGTVTDSTGAAISNATVTVHSAVTGIDRKTTSDAQGQFVFFSLPPAEYSLRASHDGFSNTLLPSVTLALGQEFVWTPQLTVSSTEATVNVTADAALLDTSSARIGGNVSPQEVAQLPINGRQISQLYLLTPGATNVGGGNFGEIRFSGRAVEQNIIRIDGIEATSIIDTAPGNLNGELNSVFRLQQSQEAIQEFRVDSNSYPAEMGTGTGGQISFLTKSGSNTLHGSIFEYVRNDYFDARNRFNLKSNAPNNPTKFRLNNFGGELGGAIIKDKLFGFGVYEGLRQVYVTSLRAGTLTNYWRSQIPVGSPIANLAAAFPADTTGTAASETPTSVANVTASAPNRIQEDFGMLRLDYHVNDRFSLYGRYNRDQGVNFQSQDISLSRFGQVMVPQNAVIALNQAWGPRLFNETKFGYNGIKMRVTGTSGPSPNADLSRTRIAVAGLSNVGSLISLSSSFNGVGAPYTGQSYSYIDNLSLVRGGHNLKFGAEVRQIGLYNNQIGGQTFTFNSPSNFVNNNADQVQFYGDLSDLSPFTGLSGQAHVKQNYYIGYAQDEWKITPELTLSYGVRYEYYSPLHEDRNKVVVFNMANGTIAPGTSADWYASSTNNWGPRVGLVYAPSMFHNKTVFRVGGGVFYGPGQTEDQIQPEANDRVSKTFSNHPYTPNIASEVYCAGCYDVNSTTLGYQPRAYAPNYRIPERVTTYTASVQQELPGQIALMVGYVGSTGRNLFLRSITNLILPGAAGVTQNATSGSGSAVREFGGRFAEVDYKTSGGVDQYHALQTTLQRRFSTGLSFGVNYTWAKELGTSSGSNEANTAQEPLQVYGSAPEYGRGNFDIRHSLNVVSLYELPIGPGKSISTSRAVGMVAGGWQIGGIVNFRSGVPIDVLITRPDLAYVGNAGTPVAGQVFSGPVCTTFPCAGGATVLTTAVVNVPGGGNSRNVRRPNIVSGVSPYNKSGVQYLNPAAFTTPAPGTFGNARRNNYSGPSLSQLDLTLTKRFAITERINTEFHANVYNVLNHPNYASPGTVRLAQSIPTGTTNAGTTVGSTYTPQTGSIQPGQAFSQSSLGNGSFGQLTQTVSNQVGIGTNRQIELALRLNF